jgi:hypothetical protein
MEETFDGKILKRFAIIYPSDLSSLVIKISHGHQGNPELPKRNIEVTVNKVTNSQTGRLFVSDVLNFPLSGHGLRMTYPDVEESASIFADDDKNYNHVLERDRAAPVVGIGEISYGVVSFHLQRRPAIAVSVFIGAPVG